MAEAESERHEETEAARPTHDEEEEELLPKKGATSVVWNFFGFRKADKDQKVILCKVCRGTVAAGGGNTSNLFHHLKIKHAKQYYESQKMRGAPAASKIKVAAPPLVQKSLAESFAKGTPYDKKSRRWREITEAITTHICKDMVPIYTVKKPGFRELLSTLDPRYVMPSRKHFTAVELPRLYGVP
ncbi:Zinc finger BED domain-containing protein 1 [Merluccius polli]|uniref:Zinc finger BED domain-containing protein 1 n=1 Tax=Merluccius polli TaxID=89951 RepID=A0AA47N8R1_MERPO|nr:Zinc finger BED domain-containing protein 1 [Merluccius polli]